MPALDERLWRLTGQMCFLPTGAETARQLQEPLRGLVALEALRRVDRRLAAGRVETERHQAPQRFSLLAAAAVGLADFLVLVVLALLVRRQQSPTTVVLALVAQALEGRLAAVVAEQAPKTPEPLVALAGRPDQETVLRLTAL
jgi:hypothetical protein